MSVDHPSTWLALTRGLQLHQTSDCSARSCQLAIEAMAAPYGAAVAAAIPPAASSSASPFPSTAPRLDTPADGTDSDVDMSQSEQDEEENEEDAEFEMDDQAASEPDSPPVRAPGFAAKQKRSKKLDLPEYLDADLYGLRRSVSHFSLVYA